MSQIDFETYAKISQEIGANEIAKQIEELKRKYENKELNVVLVGEFSSGKTSLINNFFGVELPVNVTPETATIWKIKGCKEQKYQIYFKNGDQKEYESIEEIKKLNPKEIAFVQICVEDFDENINFVDTPGLSSLDSFHKEVLENYLENADVIIVTIDINQGFVASTKNFLQDHISHSQKIYIVLTKSDTKTSQEIAQQKEYLTNNFSGFEKVIALSKGNLEELNEVLNDIQAKKELILFQRIQEQLAKICKLLYSIIDSMLEIDTSDIEALQNKRLKIENEIKKIQRKMQNEKESLIQKLDTLSSNASKKFLFFLRERREYIAEALFDDNLKESLNDRLQKVTLQASEEIVIYIQSELQKEIDSLKHNLTSDYQIEDVRIEIVNYIVEFREVIIGGLLSIFSKIPKIGTLIAIAGEPLKKLLEQGTKIFSKKYVANKLEEAFEIIAKDIEKTIKENLYQNVNLLFDEMTRELQLRQKSFEESLNKLEEEIKNRQKDIAEYRNMLLTLKNKLICK